MEKGSDQNSQRWQIGGSGNLQFLNPLFYN